MRCCSSSALVSRRRANGPGGGEAKEGRGSALDRAPIALARGNRRWGQRRTLAQRDVADEITPTSRRAASQAMAGIARLVKQSHENRPMRDAPLALVVALMSALADATTDFMIRDPANADEHGRSVFEALWQVIA